VYTVQVINIVVLSKKAEKDLATVPTHVIPGYHDEPLKGALKGQRSIRLSKAYRAYCRVVKDAVEFLRVEGVDKHEY
jgi:proteic killer suppression protein